MYKKQFVLLLFAWLPAGLFAQRGTLTGTVLNETGAALSGATIRLEPDRHLAMTNDHGHFIIKKLYEGEYTMYVITISTTGCKA